MKKQSLRNSAATNIQLKLTTRSIIAGVALVAVVLSVGVFVYLNLGTGQDSQAGTDPKAGSGKPTTAQEQGSEGADTEAAQALSFSLFSTSGDVLMQQQAKASNTAVEVNLPALPAGLYVMSVKGMKAQTQKFTVKLSTDKQKATGG